MKERSKRDADKKTAHIHTHIHRHILERRVEEVHTHTHTLTHTDLEAHTVWLKGRGTHLYLE